MSSAMTLFALSFHNSPKIVHSGKVVKVFGHYCKAIVISREGNFDIIIYRRLMSVLSLAGQMG